MAEAKMPRPKQKPDPERQRVLEAYRLAAIQGLMANPTVMQDIAQISGDSPTARGLLAYYAEGAFALADACFAEQERRDAQL